MRRCLMFAVLAAVLTGVLAAGCRQDPATGAKVQKAAQAGVVAAKRRGWHGTVTVKTTASGTFSDPGNNQFSRAESTVEFTQTASFAVGGQTQAKLTASEMTHTDSWADYDTYTLTGTVDGLTAASGMSGDARVNLEVFPNGRYTIDLFAQGIDGTLETRTTTQVRCKPGGKDPNCRDRNDETNETAPMHNLGYASGGVEGRIDSQNPNQLSGSHGDDYEHGNEVHGRTVITWSLSRS